MFHQRLYIFSRANHRLWLRRALALTIIAAFFWRGIAIPLLFAAGTTKTWTFTPAGDYTIGDSTSLEISGTSARLKVQEYADDASTAMLLHLNEASGNPVDSASPTGSPIASNVTYSAGKLNNAAAFNGTTSQVSVADSSEISLNNSHTVEAWANLNEALSANSSYSRQPILDKGSHKMYFDKDTGELVYEMALANQTAWTHVAGPISSDTVGSEKENADGTVTETWDYNGKAVVSSMVHIGSNLYVGLGAELADAEVWRFNGTSWTKVGGDKIRTSWDNEKYEMVSALAANGNTLYAGLGSGTSLNDGDAEVWALDVSSDSNNWTKIGGDGANSSWNYATAPTGQGPFEIVNTLQYAGGALYAGLGSTAAANNTDAEVWRYNGSSWTKVGGDSNQSGYGWSTAVLYESVLSMTADATYLYIGMGSTVGDADVWRATLASLAGTPSWSQIGGDGTGWAAATFEEVRELYAQGSYVYAGLGNSAAGDAEVYRWNGTAWTKIGECPSTIACTTQGWQNNLYEQVWSAWGDGTYVYFGMGNTANTDNDVWRFSDAGTEATADDTWLQIAGSAGATDIGNNHTNTRVLYHDGTSLYAGLQYANSFTGEVWKYNGSQYNWTIIGGNYINDSWGYYPTSRVDAMTTGNGKLYVGLGATASGRYGSAIVWQFDGTTWSRIGGMGKNSSWNGTFSPVVAYESVTSMAMYDGHLYVGLGLSAGDAEIWGWEVVTPNTWTKLGGDAETMVAVSSDGASNRVMTSINGTGWTIRSSIPNQAWSSVAYGMNTYVAVSSDSVTQSVMTSTDGITWTPRDAAAANAWQSVTYGEGLFVAVANSGTDNRVMTSPNGIDWTIRTSAADNNWKSVTYGNGMFVAVANSGTNNRVMTSLNGTAWTIQTTPSDIAWNSVTYGNGTFVAVANDGVTASVMTSTDGAAWSIQNAAAANAWQSVAFGKGTFVAVSSTGAQRAMTSTNGASWTIATAATASTWKTVTYHQSYNANLGIFVAVADSGTNRNMYSTNLGSTWTANAVTNNSWTAAIGPAGWSTTAAIESVQSMTVHTCPGVTSMCLYTGLGLSANDGKVFAYNTSGWQQVGGYGTTGNWEALSIEVVNSLVSYKGKLYAALGNTAPAAANGDGELWEYAGTGTTWTKVAGDGVNSSWSYAGLTANGSIESVNTTSIYAGDLYVGLGTTSNSSDLADADVWKWSGSGNWTKIGGDGVNGSWDNSQTYESVRSMSVYNGELYVGLGDTAAVANFIDSEVWKWNGTTWTIVGGESANFSSWPDTVVNNKEQVYALAAYNGKLFAGLGNSVGDSAIWSYGGNAVVRTTTTTTQPTGWRHIAAVYDQSAGSNQLKIYIDGVEKGATTVTSAVVDNALPLLIGTEYGTRYVGERIGFFNGMLDELRLSSTARSTFNLAAYSDDPQPITLTVPHFTSGIKAWTDFDAVEAVAGEGILYRISIDGGTTWKYWNGSAWATSTINFSTDNEATIISRANTKGTIDSNIATLAASSGGIVWQAILNGDGTQQVTLDSVSVSGTVDNTAPTNPTVITALDQSGGAVNLTADTWYSYTAPYFEWSGAADPENDPGDNSGVAGYYIQFVEAVSNICNDDDPITATGANAFAFTASPSFTPSSMASGTSYCLRIQTVDNAGNRAATLDAFKYKFDNTNDAVPNINPIPGFIDDASVTFTWSAVTGVNGAPVQKLQYKTGATIDSIRGTDYADWQDLAGNATTVTIGGTTTAAKASYQDGSNTFYLRVVDIAGNIGTPGTEVYNSSGEGPSAPQNLSVLPETTALAPTSTCNFTFQWDPPLTYLGGDENALTYCYRVNGAPDETYCSGKYSAAGVTSATGCFDGDGTGNGTNIFYVVARNPDSQGGTANYAATAGINFYLDTDEPGPPVQLEASDTSQKSLSKWKIGLSWLEPELNPDVVDTYQIYIRKETEAYGTTFKVASDPYYEYRDLDQETYYLKVRACDVVGKCGIFSDEVDMYPTGKFTDPAVIVSGPTVSAITTKKATVSWGTDRTSDSKVQYGTGAGSYFTEEPSNSLQLTAHEITLNNLAAGTTYYYRVKWTDEDGNTGKSSEKSFSTEPAPSVKDAVTSKVGITSAYVNFTATGATKVKVYYGETAAFGNVKTISTGLAETEESIELSELKDDTKYYYRINALDSDGVEYDGTTLSFTTLPRPRIQLVRVQQISGTAQPAILVSWTTNTPVSSIVTFYPTSNPSDVKDEVNVELTSGEHQMILRGLLPKTPYTLTVAGRDKAGNEARSDKQAFTTATDTRPAKISNVKVEGSISKVGSGTDQKLAQLIISWSTDEPATSQVEYGEGTSTTYPQKTQEDAQLKVNHLVVISNLPTSRVYHMRAVSVDTAGNISPSIDTVTITPKGSNDALDLVMGNLLESFGFLRDVLK